MAAPCVAKQWRSDSAFLPISRDQEQQNSWRKCVCQTAKMGGWCKKELSQAQEPLTLQYSLGEQCDFFVRFVVPEVKGGIFLVSTTRKHCKKFFVVAYPWKYSLVYKTFLLSVLVAVIGPPELL